MMHYTLLAALAFAISCAPATSRRTYRDGVEVAPAAEFAPPGYAPAGAGLPEYVPGPPVPMVERGRDRRVLPPTRDPGIWASDGPTHVDVEDLKVLGVQLLLPDSVYENGEGDVGPALFCAKHWNKVVNTDAARWLREIKDETLRKCLVAFMNEECVKLPEAVHEGILKPSGIISIAARAHLPEAKRRAERFTDVMCRDARTIGFYVDRFKKLVPEFQESALREALEAVR